jgi:spore germination cell wall hydrolase CwlJ-like protein
MLISNLRLPAFRKLNLSFRQGMASFVLVTVFALNLFAGIALFSGLGGTEGRAVARVTPNLAGAVRAAPAPEPLTFRADVAPQDAVAINAAVPVVDGPNPPAKAFVLAAKSGIDANRAIDCLTSAIYYEAATESDDGKRAVAQVVLNRVRHPAYPNTVCGVVFQGSERATGCQFSYTCDGSLARRPMAAYWNRARAIAQEMLAGKVFAPVGWATHYHTNYVVPYWSSSLVKAAVIGTHIFYRWTGGWGRGPAFADKHAGVEPDVTGLGRRTEVQMAATAASDAAAAAAAAAAIAANDFAKLTPEQKALIEKDPNGKVLPPSSMDSFQRAVLRRYEPTQGQQVSRLLAQSAATDRAVSNRWALTGQAEGQTQTPFGKQPEKAAPAKTAEAKPAAPVELDGVRKLTPVGDRPAS